MMNFSTDHVGFINLRDKSFDSPPEWRDLDKGRKSISLSASELADVLDYLGDALAKDGVGIDGEINPIGHQIDTLIGLLGDLGE